MSDMSWALPWNWGPSGEQYGAQAAIDANLAANAAAAAANAAAVQAASQAASIPTGYNPVYQGVSNGPGGQTIPGTGYVGGYPSFGEASGGGDYGTGTPSTAEQPFSPSGTGGYYTYDINGSPSWVGGGIGSDATAAPNQPNLTPQQWYVGGYDPYSSQSYQPAAQQNVGSGWPTAAVQPQEPAYQPYTNPYTGYPFNEAYPPGQNYAPQSSPSYEWPPAQQGGYYTYDINGSPSWVSGGGSASAEASGQGDVWGGGAASAAAAYNPFNQYANGGYDPFNYQTYQPAAQQNVGSWRGQSEAAQPQQQSGSPGEGSGYYTYDINGSPSWVGGGGSFADRFGGAEQPQFPSAIAEGGYPRWDQRWDQIGDPYTNVPLNNALWQRGMDAGPQQPSGGYSPGEGSGYYTYDINGSPSWVPGGGAQGGGSGYSPFQQYQSGGYDPFASSYENDLNQILRGVDQGRGSGQQDYPSWQPPSDTLTPDDRSGGYTISYDINGSPTYVYGGGGPRDAAARAIMAQGGDDPSMADFQSPANNYDTFQGAADDQWQTLIPQGRADPSLINSVYKGSGDTGVSPSALANLFTRESTWNAQEGTIGGNYGIGQIAPDDFKLSGGTLGGLTYDQYTRAPADQQAGAYYDFLDGILSRNPSLDITKYDAPTQYAIIQALNFTPWNASRWLPAFLAGDSTVPTTTSRQGSLGYPSIDDLKRSYR